MSDRELRRLEQAAATGDIVAQQKYLKALLRAGYVTDYAICHAKRLGHPVADVLCDPNQLSLRRLTFSDLDHIKTYVRILTDFCYRVVHRSNLAETQFGVASNTTPPAILPSLNGWARDIVSDEQFVFDYHQITEYEGGVLTDLAAVAINWADLSEDPEIQLTASTFGDAYYFVEKVAEIAGHISQSIAGSPTNEYVAFYASLYLKAQICNQIVLPEVPMLEPKLLVYG